MTKRPFATNDQRVDLLHKMAKKGKTNKQNDLVKLTKKNQKLTEHIQNGLVGVVWTDLVKPFLVTSNLVSSSKNADSK